MRELNKSEIYTRFLALQMHYASRNALLDEFSAYFKGDQWETSPEDEVEELEGEEEIKITLNYVRKSVLWHVGLLTGKPPRVDVPTTNPAAERRERYLRAILASVSFRRAQRRLEVSANKYGYGVLQALWKPAKGQPISKTLAAREGVTAKRRRYTLMPFRFRAINPRRFYPCYCTYDDPDDFLYVIRHDPGRLTEDIEDKYNVELAPTDWGPGTRGTCELIEYWDDKRYVLIALTRQLEEETGEELTIPTVLVEESHPYERPPFFVLPNFVSDPDEDPTYLGSLSEVDLISDVNQHLNLVVSLLESEIATRIHPPAVYKSDDPQQDPNNIRIGAGEVIPIGVEEELDVLNWTGVPQTVAEHRDALMSALRDFSGLPKTSLGTAEGASGIGMRLAYAVLEMILPLKVPERTEFLANMLAFVLRVTESQLKKDDVVAFQSAGNTAAALRKTDITEDYFCKVKYGNLIPRNKIEWEQHVLYVFKTGAISHRTALELLEDIEDPGRELERIKTENQDVTLNPDKAGLIQQLKQGPEKPEKSPLGAPEAGVGLKFDAAPPVPQTPAMPTQQNAPFLQRGQTPNLQPGGPGVYGGPPLAGAG